MNENKQITWINCAKFMAILAVMIDHSNNILYGDDRIQKISFYSVSLFIIISGMLCYCSNERNDSPYIKTTLKSLSKIVPAYLIATFIYQVGTYKYFNFQTYIEYLVRFNASSPFYFVLLYIQLMLVNKIMYNILVKKVEKWTWIKDFVWGGVFLFVSILTTKYSNIFGIYGGGGKLLGGTYLILFYIGMILSKYNIFGKISMKKSILCTGVFGTLWVAWNIYSINNWQVIDDKLPWGWGINPPGITLMLSALFMLFFCYGVFTLLERQKYTGMITSVLGWIGSHTLYIFLYHYFYLDFILSRHVPIDNIMIKWVVYIFVMIFGSIVIEHTLVILKKYINFK